MRACWLCWTGCLWRWNSPTVTTGLASLAVGLGGGGPHRLVEVVLDHKPFLADDAPQRGRCGPAMRLNVDEHPVRAGHCPQLGHDGCLKGDAFVESHLHVGGRFEWYCGFDQIELDSPRASLGHIRTERWNRRRFRRYQRLTPVVALRIHRPEVRS